MDPASGYPLQAPPLARPPPGRTTAVCFACWAGIIDLSRPAGMDGGHDKSHNQWSCRSLLLLLLCRVKVEGGRQDKPRPTIKWGRVHLVLIPRTEKFIQLHLRTVCNYLKLGKLITSFVVELITGFEEHKHSKAPTHHVPLEYVIHDLMPRQSRSVHEQLEGEL